MKNRTKLSILTISVCIIQLFAGILSLVDVMAVVKTGYINNKYCIPNFY